MNVNVLILERKTVFTALTTPIAMVVAALMSIYAVTTGTVHHRTIDASLTEFAAAANAKAQTWRETLQKIENGTIQPTPRDAQPMDIAIPAVLSSAPLADFAIGPGDLHPVSTTVSPRSNSVDLFSKYQLSNPTVLALGRIDLVFIVIIVMPLLMIAVSFDALAADRQHGLLRMSAAQSAGLAEIAWTRLIVRNASTWLPVLLVVLIALVVNTGSALAPRLEAFTVWALFTGLYALVWFAAIAFAVAYLHRPQSVVATLVAAWGLAVLVMPALIGAVGEAFYPAPSRLAYQSEMRQAQGMANREVDRLTSAFLLDHPDLTVSEDEVPSYHRRVYLANREVEQRTAPILESFEDARENRQNLFSAVQYLSPAIVVENALDAAAGADTQRYLRFQSEARTVLAELSSRVGPAIVARRRISVAEFDAIPRFRFEEKPGAHVLTERTTSLIYLALLAGGLIVLAHRRLNAPLEKLL